MGLPSPDGTSQNPAVAPAAVAPGFPRRLFGRRNLAGRERATFVDINDNDNVAAVSTDGKTLARRLQRFLRV
jgi:hypothetical protein